MPISLNGSTGIQFPDSSLQAAAASPYVLKNRIINGAMVVDQRNAGASVTPTVSTTYTLDRWGYSFTQASKASIQQNAGSVTPPVGFSNYYGFTSLSAYSVLSSDIFAIAQFIEGFNTADLNWGTANAKTVTLSFWVRSSLTGTFGGAITNSPVDRSYPFTYSIPIANTWTFISVTIAGDTTGTWIGATNGIGMRVWLGVGMGSTNSGTAGAWAGADYRSATGATSVVGTNGATFYITGVQLEQNTSATPFERRLYNQELANCQRYYYRISASSNSQPFANAFCDSTTVARGVVPFPVTMRDRPTALEQSGTAANYAIVSSPTGQNCTSVPAFSNSTVISSEVNFTIASGLVAGQGCIIRSGSASGASAYLAWSAEL
jgi:hypothetical protein